MASLSFTNGFVSINGVDLSAYTRSVTINYSAEMLDETAMADTTRVNLGGLKNWSMEFEFNQDFASSATDVSLFSLVGTASTLIVRPTASAVSTTNPNYTGSGILESYTPFGNSVGDLATANAMFVSAGALSRATA